MKYFLYYGLIGDWIISQFKRGSVLGILVAFVSLYQVQLFVIGYSLI